MCARVKTSWLAFADRAAVRSVRALRELKLQASSAPLGRYAVCWQERN